MGSTNKTTNYELSQYIGTDKPSWLNDYNNDMLKIDTQMKANATAAGNAQSTATAADGKADANTESISTLNTQINTPSTGLAATVAAHTTDITNINSKIGNTPLTTAAQTLTGAIEEVKGSVPSLTGTITFNGTKEITVTSDGVKTYAALLNELYAAFFAYISQKTAAYRFQINNITIQGVGTIFFPNNSFNDNSFASGVRCVSVNVSSTHVYTSDVYCASSSSVYYLATDTTVTDNSATVPDNNKYFKLVITEFTVNS